MATYGFKSISISGETYYLLKTIAEQNNSSMSEIITDLAQNAAMHDPILQQKMREYEQKIKQLEALKAQLFMDNDEPRRVTLETIKSGKNARNNAGVPLPGYSERPEITIDTENGSLTIVFLEVQE